jgi:hypothetical protein
MDLVKLILILFLHMKIILNSVTFVVLVWKLWNNKHSHHLVKSFLTVQKMEEGPTICEGYDPITNKQMLVNI